MPGTQSTMAQQVAQAAIAFQRNTGLAPTDARDRFKKVAWPFVEHLLRTARFLTHDMAEAEDLVQNSILKAWRAFGSFRKGTDVRAWLLTILRRTHIDHLRHNTRRPECQATTDDVASSTSAPTPTELDQRWGDARLMMEQFDDDEITDALRALPDEIRWTVLLVHVEQLDHEKAAAVMGVPVGTVKSRAYRGRQMLKKWLTEVASSQPAPAAERIYYRRPRELGSPAVDCPHHGSLPRGLCLMIRGSQLWWQMKENS